MIKAPAELVRQTVSTMETRGRWDAMFDKGRRVEHLDPVTSVVYICMKVGTYAPVRWLNLPGTLAHHPTRDCQCGSH